MLLCIGYPKPALRLLAGSGSCKKPNVVILTYMYYDFNPGNRDVLRNHRMFDQLRKIAGDHLGLRQGQTSIFLRQENQLTDTVFVGFAQFTGDVICYTA